jgi:hypothetical protein
MVNDDVLNICNVVENIDISPFSLVFYQTFYRAFMGF